MRDFDEDVKKAAEKEPIKISPKAQEAIENTLANLDDAPKHSKTYYFWTRFAASAACFVFVFLFVLPNVSVAYAKTLEEVPVLGRFIQVVTIRNYFMQDDHHELDVEVPQIDNVTGQAVENLNQDTQALTSTLVKQFYEDLEKNGGAGFGSLHVDYEKWMDTKSWFTLKLDITETAASSNQYYKYYHMDKQKNVVITLGDLFRNEAYKSMIKEEIRKQIDAQMQADPENVYFVSEAEFGMDFAEVQETHNFYWNTNGDLVIPFDKYEIAPGSMGTPEFTISKDLLKNTLKPEYQNLVF